MINHKTKIYVAGHRGMVGSAISKLLTHEGYTNIIFATSKELDLRNQSSVSSFFENNRPELVIDAAARVGGIMANSMYPYQFLMENMLIQNNLIDASHKYNVNKFIFLGSSCIYPKLAPQPINEDDLLTGSLEATNEWYAIAKITGVKSCQAIRYQFKKDFVSLMPTNLYGPFDNFDKETSHVLPAMIRKFHEAKINNSDVELWGSGNPLREFLHVDDLAKAVMFAVNNTLPDYLYNVGYGHDLSIKDLAYMVQKTVGHKGGIRWNNSKPDGTPKKLMDSSKMNALGWKPTISLEAGLKDTYGWFLKHINEFKEVKI